MENIFGAKTKPSNKQKIRSQGDLGNRNTKKPLEHLSFCLSWSNVLRVLGNQEDSLGVEGVGAGFSASPGALQHHGCAAAPLGNPNLGKSAIKKSFRSMSFPWDSHVLQKISLLSSSAHPYCSHLLLWWLPRWLRGKEFTCWCRRHAFDPWVRKIPWRRKWQLQYSCLENSTDRGAWQATVHRFAKSQTWMSDWECTHTAFLEEQGMWRTTFPISSLCF